MFSEKTIPRTRRLPRSSRFFIEGMFSGREEPGVKETRGSGIMTRELPGRTSKILPRKFYRRETATVARDLLGKVLRVRNGRIWRSGVIVETEAYVGNDPANHAYRGLNRRNQSMFKEPGTVYVYPIHRVHCVNVVTRKGEAVLIRALHALNNVSSSTSGPGRLCRALNITKSRHDGLGFSGSEIQITKHEYAPFEIGVSKRIGISKAKEKRLRFFARDNPYVSR